MTGWLERRAAKQERAIRTLLRPLCDGEVVAVGGLAPRGAMRVARANVASQAHRAVPSALLEGQGYAAQPPASILGDREVAAQATALAPSMLAALTDRRLHLFAVRFRRRTPGFARRRLEVERTVAVWDRRDIRVTVGTEQGTRTVTLDLPTRGERHKLEIWTGLGAGGQAERLVDALLRR